LNQKVIVENKRGASGNIRGKNSARSERPERANLLLREISGRNKEPLYGEIP